MTKQQLRLQVANQCRAVAELAAALAEVHRQVASAYEHGNGDTTLDMVGRRTAGFMETLGDWLNNMDAAEVSPDWLVDVFAEAQRLYPQQPEPPSRDSVNTIGVVGLEPPASHIDAFLAMALPRIAALMQADPEDATPEGRELMLLADLADRYERQKYPEFSGRPVKPHRSGGGGPPAPEPPIEVLPRHPNRTAE